MSELFLSFWCKTKCQNLAEQQIHKIINQHSVKQDLNLQCNETQKKCENEKQNVRTNIEIQHINTGFFFQTEQFIEEGWVKQSKLLSKGY